jgi:Subtilase family
MFAYVAAMCAVTVSLFATTQPIGSNDNWGLDRIDQRSGRDNVFQYVADGRGVNVFILDSGVNVNHIDFLQDESGNARTPQSLGNFYGATSAQPVNGDITDCGGYDGHGTHNASFAVGKTFGVAKAASLLVAKISGGPGCDGDSTGAKWAIRYIRNNYKPQSGGGSSPPAVINLSFRFTDANLNSEINAATADGFVVTLSAGCVPNVAGTWGTAASQQSGGTLIVAGLNASDGIGVGQPSASDYGPSLTLFAPAIGVTGARSSSNIAGNAQPTDGTCADSFAAPHVAGVAATYLQDHPNALPATVRSVILGLASPTAFGTPLLYSRVNLPPTDVNADFTSDLTSEGVIGS